MKPKLLLKISIFSLLCVFFVSCSSSRYARFEKKSPGAALGRQLNKKDAPENIFNGSNSIVVNDNSASSPSAGEIVLPSANPVHDCAVAVNSNAQSELTVSPLKIAPQVQKPAALTKKRAKAMFRAITKDAAATDHITPARE